MNEKEPIINYDEVVKYIVNKTSIDTDVVDKVLFHEIEYLINAGVMDEYEE